MTGKMRFSCLVWNTEWPQSDAWLTRNLQNCSVYQIIEKQFVKPNRSHENTKQIICDILRSENAIKDQ